MLTKDRAGFWQKQASSKIVQQWKCRTSKLAMLSLMRDKDKLLHNSHVRLGSATFTEQEAPRQLPLPTLLAGFHILS